MTILRLVPQRLLEALGLKIKKISWKQKYIQIV